MAAASSIDAMIETFERSLEGRPSYAIGMIGLAGAVAARSEGEPVRIRAAHPEQSVSPWACRKC